MSSVLESVGLLREAPPRQLSEFERIPWGVLQAAQTGEEGTSYTLLLPARRVTIHASRVRCLQRVQPGDGVSLVAAGDGTLVVRKCPPPASTADPG